MYHYRRMIAVEADPDVVFKLLADIASWPALFPHVRSRQPGDTGRCSMTLVWRWMPFTAKIASRSDSERRTLEQRLGGPFGVRATCHWEVHAGSGGMVSLRLAATVVQAAPLVGTSLAGLVLRDLCDDTLEMVRLLAESDRRAHAGVT